MEMEPPALGGGDVEQQPPIEEPDGADQVLPPADEPVGDPAGPVAPAGDWTADGGVRRRMTYKRTPAPGMFPESKVPRTIFGLDVCLEEEPGLPIDSEILLMNLAVDYGYSEEQELNEVTINNVAKRIQMQDFSWDLGPCDKVLDAATGELLPANLVKEGREKEMQQMRKHAVWELTPEKEAVGGKKVRLKWVDLRRGDEVRSRLVAMEVAYDFRPESETFAGTPPLSIIRLLISIAATGAMDGPSAMLITIYDVSCAFLDSLIDELIWIRFPPGLGPAGYVGELRKSMYGTRRASLLWGEHVGKTFTNKEFYRAKLWPALLREDEEHHVRGSRR